MERFFVELSDGNCNECNCDCHGDACYCITN